MVRSQNLKSQFWGKFPTLWFLVCFLSLMAWYWQLKLWQELHFFGQRNQEDGPRSLRKCLVFSACLPFLPALPQTQTSCPAAAALPLSPEELGKEALLSQRAWGTLQKREIRQECPFILYMTSIRTMLVQCKTDPQQHLKGSENWT